MSESLRQLGIKMRAVKRLAADVHSYVSEKQQHTNKLDALVAQQAEPHTIRRQREFVEEADATIQDVRTRLQESYANLQTFLEEVESQGDAEVLSSDVFVQSRQILEETASLVAVSGDEHKDDGFKVTVFGASRTQPHDQLWHDSAALGEALAERNYHVITGGYGGTMTAVSEGASRVRGAKIEGVLCAPCFPMNERGNNYINIETPTHDLCERIVSLIRPADAFIVLPGNIGTLTELIVTWNVSCVETLSAKPPLIILVCKEPWQAIVESLGEKLGIPESFMKILTFIDTPLDALEHLERMREHKRSSKLHMHIAAPTALVGAHSDAAKITYG